MALPDFIDATVATRPQRTFTVSAVDYKSVWNTCHNPLVYNIQLFGDVIDYIDNSVTGGVDCYIHSATIAATYIVGDKIFLYGTTYNGYYTVVAISGHYVTIDAIYIGDDLNEQYITNLRIKANLKIEIEVWAKEIDSDPYTPTLIAVSKYTPSAIRTGFYNQLQVKADISQFIQGVLKSCKDEIDYDLAYVNLEDINNFTYFYIKYREIYTNSATAFIDDRDNPLSTAFDDPNTCYAVKSVAQLQQLNGGSLFKHETFDFDRIPNAKFISGFSRPKYYGTNYPFDLMYISSLVVYDSAFHAYFVPYSSSGVAGTELVVDLDVWDIPSIQRLMIDLPFGDEGDWDNAAYFSVRIGTTTDDTFIDTIYVTIENTLTLCNPVYLKAKNDLGCWDYFMFERNQELVQDSVSGGFYSPYVTNIETANTNNDLISKLSKNSIQVGANGLSVIDFDAYKSLARSPKVYMLTNEAAPWQWTTVILRNNSIKRNTRHSTFDCEFTLDLPDTYNMSN